MRRLCKRWATPTLEADKGTAALAGQAEPPARPSRGPHSHHPPTSTQAAPDLFSNTRRRVFTEFGRALTSKAGLIVSQVEYAKQTELEGTADASSSSSPPRIAILHAGADVLMRACYRPEIYSHRVSAYGPDGSSLDGPTVVHDLAGPLCFAGDYPKKGVHLPSIEAGDYVVVHDAGANTLALWSKHCSRLAMPVYSYSRDADGRMRVRKRLEGESLENMLGFWGAQSPQTQHE